MSHNIDYKKYLHSPEWICFRKKIAFARKKCAVCGSSKRLNVHHRHYLTIFNEGENDVELLCEKHHKKLHKISKSKGISFDCAMDIVLHCFLNNPKKRKRYKENRLRRRKAQHILTKEEKNKLSYARTKRMKELRAKRAELWK